VIKPQPNSEINPVYLQEVNAWQWATKESRRSPKFQVGETIFVKESFWRNKKHKKFCWYDTDIFQCSDSLEKVNAKFMKQEQSRLFLKITGVKVKKLQEIVEEDIKLEGFKTDYKIWNSTHIKPEEKWEANPWVWAFDYEVI
jgi:hypothetical protein